MCIRDSNIPTHTFGPRLGAEGSHFQLKLFTGKTGVFDGICQICLLYTSVLGFPHGCDGPSGDGELAVGNHLVDVNLAHHPQPFALGACALRGVCLLYTSASAVEGMRMTCPIRKFSALSPGLASQMALEMCIRDSPRSAVRWLPAGHR